MKLPIEKTVKYAFDQFLDIKFDRAFILKVINYTNDFINKDENSINFFGGNLTGVFPIVWSKVDRNNWINNVLGIEVVDFDILTEHLYHLPDINKSFKVSSNPINLSCIWIAHHALISDTLNEKEKMALASAAINMLQYKFISSILYNDFKYPANIAIATAVYESLNNRFSLKKAGSWQALIQMRTDEIIADDTLHTHTLRSLDDNISIVKMLNDIQSRLRSIINILNTRFYEYHEKELKIATTSKFSTFEGEKFLKDATNKYISIKTAMDAIVPDVNAFINDDVRRAILLTVNTVYPAYLDNTLKVISKNYFKRIHGVNVHDLVDEILMFSFDVLQKESIPLHDLGIIGIKMKGVLRSSRLISPEYNKIKKNIAVIIEEANPDITELTLPGTRIGVMIYILIRALVTIH